MIGIIIYDQQKWASNTLLRLCNCFFLLFFFYAIASASSDLMYAVRNEDNMERCDIFTSSPCVFLPSLAQDLEERRTFVMQCFSVRVYVCFCQRDLAVEKEKRAHLLTSTIGEIVRLFSMGRVWNNFYHCVPTGSAKVPKVKISLVLSVWWFPPVSP